MTKIQVGTHFTFHIANYSFIHTCTHLILETQKYLCIILFKTKTAISEIK